MIYRIKFSIGGGHVHCSLFVSQSPNHTFAKCGDFCVRRGEEFVALLRDMNGVAFIGIDDKVGITEASKP